MSETHAFRHIPRERLTDHERAELFLERDGRCHMCDRKLRSGDRWVAEHLQSLAAGGSNEWENWRITCEWCLPAKNAADAKVAAKIKRVAIAHVIPQSQRQKKSRPMPGSKRSGWKKTFSSGWVRR